jgi:hypothetical protein
MAPNGAHEARAVPEELASARPWIRRREGLPGSSLGASRESLPRQAERPPYKGTARKRVRSPEQVLAHSEQSTMITGS